MALNPKSLNRNNRKAAGRKKTPVKLTKRTMNFVRHGSGFAPCKVLPMVLVIAVIMGVFVKVGILDLLDRKESACNQLAARQEQLTDIQSRLTGYEALANRYGRYSYGWMNETEANLVNRMDVLTLVEEIASTAHVENMAVNNNVLTMNIYGITLEQAGAMVNQLERSALVNSASVYSASAQDGREARIFISITLTRPAAEEGA